MRASDTRELVCARPPAASAGSPGFAARPRLGEAVPSEELRPTRLLHKAAEVLNEFESRRQLPAAVTKNLLKRCISIDEERICYIFNNELKFTPFARARYEQGELEIVQGYATS